MTNKFKPRLYRLKPWRSISYTSSDKIHVNLWWLSELVDQDHTEADNHKTRKLFQKNVTKIAIDDYSICRSTIINRKADYIIVWKKLFITATSLTDFSPQIDKISSILNDELHKCPTKRTTPQCAHSIPNCAAFRKLPIQGFLLLIAQDKLPTLDVSLLRRLVCLHIDERENIFFLYI